MSAGAPPESQTGVNHRQVCKYFRALISYLPRTISITAAAQQLDFRRVPDDPADGQPLKMETS
jgi:hypothetical protein